MRNRTIDVAPVRVGDAGNQWGEGVRHHASMIQAHKKDLRKIETASGSLKPEALVAAKRHRDAIRAHEDALQAWKTANRYRAHPDYEDEAAALSVSANNRSNGLVLDAKDCIAPVRVGDAKSIAEIRREIAAHKKDMKANGLRIMSFMNRQEPEQRRANEQLFRLKTELERAEKEENVAKDHVTLEPVPVSGERELRYTARDSSLSTGLLAALIAAIVAHFYGPEKTVGPQDYDLTRYRPKRREW